MTLLSAEIQDDTPGAETRTEQIRAFLAASGWADAECRPLAGDASPRRYHRVTARGLTAVLMDAPPGPDADAHPFLAVTRWLRMAGLSAPEIHAADPETGLILLEDLGDGLFVRLLADGSAAEALLYEAATDVLLRLHSLPPPAGDAHWIPAPYDRAVYLREARLSVEWYLPATAGRAVPGEISEAFDAAFLPLLAPVLEARPVAVLRDYHAENLLWLPERRAEARVGLLDYQDLLIGHPAYDLISLLEDARRDTSAELRSAMVARYLAATGIDEESFSLALHLLAAQRNLKIIGIFVRLCRRDGKPGYLRHLPRVWAHLQRDLAHPALAPLRDWCACLPPPEPDVLRRIAADVMPA